MHHAGVKFRSTGSYEPDHEYNPLYDVDLKFRSTGSYEPDLAIKMSSKGAKSFDPQALTSLTYRRRSHLSFYRSFDPQALTSLTLRAYPAPHIPRTFRSTGSYEPDLANDVLVVKEALVSIHRLLRA